MAHIWVPNRHVLSKRTYPDHSWFRESGRPAFFDPAPGGPDNVLDTYTWSVSYSGEGATSGAWPEAGGLTSHDLSTTGTLTLNVSTTGLTTSGGIGAARANRAVTLATGAGQGLINTSNNWDFNPGDRHWRGIFDNTGVSNNARLWMYLVNGTRWQEIRYITASDQLYHYTRYDASGGIYIATVTGVTGGWHLVDSSYTPDGGSSGFAQWSIYVDGTDAGVAEHTAVLDPANNGDAIGVWARESGNTIFDGTGLFQGWRWGALLGLTAHQSDATALGV